MRDTEYIRDLLKQAEATSFAYSHEAKQFSIGTRDVTIEAAVHNPRLLTTRSLATDHLDDPADKDPMLAVALWHHVSYPSMYDWLDERFDAAMADETVEVMIDAFGAADPSIPRKHLRPDKGGFMGFSAERTRSEHPHVSLTVLGNCACLYASVSGFIGEHDWDSKFTNYEMHNVDTPVQTVSILAGLGHLASRAAKEIHT